MVWCPTIISYLVITVRRISSRPSMEGAKRNLGVISFGMGITTWLELITPRYRTTCFLRHLIFRERYGLLSRQMSSLANRVRSRFVRWFGLTLAAIVFLKYFVGPLGYQHAQPSTIGVPQDLETQTLSLFDDLLRSGKILHEETQPELYKVDEFEVAENLIHCPSTARTKKTQSVVATLLSYLD